MTSKAQRKATRKARGSSNAGRPRKDGPRHPGGKLIQAVEPNARVIENRKAMIGDLKIDLSVAEDAMKLALAHGWLTEVQHRAGEAFSRAYRSATPPTRLSNGSPQESPNASDRDMRTIGQMGSAEIVAAFDRILASTPSAGASEDRQIQARRKYLAMSNAMTPAEHGEVVMCFVSRSWPQWINQRASGRFDTPWERKRVLLVSGLNALAAHLKRRSAAKPMRTVEALEA